VLMLAALALVGRTLHFGAWFYGGLGVAAATFLYQQWLIRARDPAACLQAFLNNNYTGVAIFAGLLLQYLYGVGAPG
jgi:4-hydroxybenzoate polyprenyltransferase